MYDLDTMSKVENTSKPLGRTELYALKQIDEVKEYKSDIEDNKTKSGLLYIQEE
jgi:hypothetical protein